MNFHVNYRAYLTGCALLFAIVFNIDAQDNSYNFKVLEKRHEDLILFDRLSDISYVDKVRLAGPPKAVQKETGCEFLDSLSDNQLIFYSYLFIPKDVKQGKKYPMIVFSHGGIHGTMGSTYVHILRELVSQGYIVIAPDYRGSTGYGKGFHQAIDYGGLENEDVLAARDYMVENYSIVDSTRIGLLGWSHGGMITLMNLLQYPDKYACGYAGVPVSDVTYRLSYQEENYKDNFSPNYHIGSLPEEAPQEYARRSPVLYAKYLKKPLMITTCVNDDDVSVTEVQRMIDSLTFYKKDFEYKVYPKMEGAHVFERIDIKEASEIRYLTYKFLEKYLNPPHKFKSYNDLRKAGYRYY